MAERSDLVEMHRRMLLIRGFEQRVSTLYRDGEVPGRDVLTTLARRCYDGWICVEWEKMWHPEIEEPDVAFPQHLRTMRQYLSAPSA